jgi:hypothetical protein
MQIIIETTRSQLLQLVAGVIIFVFIAVLCAFYAGGDVVRAGLVNNCTEYQSFSIKGHEGLFLCMYQK